MENLENKIEPFDDRVVVLQDPPKEKSSGGVIIPETAQEKSMKGTVVAVGPGTKDTKMTAKVGDSVLFGKYSGMEFEFDGTMYLLMRQSDLQLRIV